MKKQLIVIMALVFALMAVSQAQVRPNVVVSSFGIKEGIAAVGKDFVLAVNLVNIEPSACAYTVTVNVQAPFPFISKGVTTVPAGDLCSGSPVEVDFPMKVDPTAAGGFYQLNVLSDYETSTLAALSSSDTINVYVNGTPDIVAYITNSNPIDVYPGDTSTLTVTVENSGSFQAQSVSALLSSNSEIEVSPSNSFGFIGLLSAKQSKALDFTVEVPKNSKLTEYKLNFEVQYQDENLVERTKTFVFTFTIKKKAFFELKDAGSDTLYPNQNSKTVRLTLSNTGSDAAYKIKAKVLPQFPFSTDGSTRYVDVLPAGGSAAVDFVVDTDKDGTPGSYGLDLLLDFEDAQSKSLQDTATFSVLLNQKSFFRATFIDYWFVWAALVIVIALIISGRFRRAKKLQQSKK